MPDAASHLRQARENLEHAEWILVMRPTDDTALRWAVTAAFYCALHCMTAHLVGRGVSVRKHEDRERELRSRRNGVPFPVFDAYRQLKRRSVVGRYMLQIFTPPQVRALFDGPLATVTSFVKL